MSVAWYAIHSQPHKEDQLANQLHAYNIEVFYPCISVKPVNPRSKKIRPYFPGYMFVRSDLDDIGVAAFQRMPYATGLVEFGGEPSVVPDTMIIAIKNNLAHQTTSHNEDSLTFQPNDAVIINSGAFEGFEALFDKKISGNDRVRVLLHMLNNRYIPIDLQTKNIKKKSMRR